LSSESYTTRLLTFWKGLLSTRSLGEKLLALGDSLSTESDTLLRVQDGSFPDQSLDASCTTINLVECHLIDDLGAVLSMRVCISLSSCQLASLGGLLSECLDLLDLLGQ
jgi:hypothetical protein